MRLPLLILIVFLAVFFLQWQSAYPELPDRVATHFDGAGRPNGWSSKDSFVVISVVMVAIFFLPLVIAMAALGRFPDSMVNLPRKDYWLAPERRQETFAFIHRRLLWMCVGFVAFGVYVNHLVLEANLSTPPRLSDHFLWALIAIFVALGIWLVSFLGRFLRVPRAA